MNLQGYVFRDGARPLLPQVRLQPCVSSPASPLPPGLRGQGREPRVPPGRAPRRCLSFALRPRGRLRGVSRACLPVRQPPRPRPACSIVVLFAGEPSTWLCFLLPSSWRRRFMSARPSARTCSHLLAPARTCSRLPAGAFPGAPLRLRRRLDAPGISGWACLFLTRAEVSLVRGVAGGSSTDTGHLGAARDPGSDLLWRGGGRGPSLGGVVLAHTQPRGCHGASSGDRQRPLPREVGPRAWAFGWGAALSGVPVLPGGPPLCRRHLRLRPRQPSAVHHAGGPGIPPGLLDNDPGRGLPGWGPRPAAEQWGA